MSADRVIDEVDRLTSRIVRGTKARAVRLGFDAESARLLEEYLYEATRRKILPERRRAIATSGGHARAARMRGLK